MSRNSFILEERKMKPRSIIMIFVIVSLVLACNLPISAGQAEPSATPFVLPADKQPSSVETSVSLPTETPTSALTPTPATPIVTPLKEAVNCRFGPETTFASIGSGLAAGVSAEILGKSADGGWWQIQSSDGSLKCWVAASVTTATGDLSAVGVVAPPLAFVTNATLQVKPDSINLDEDCNGPDPHFSFKGAIHVNGPTTVKWHFETQEDGSMSEHSIKFTSFGFKEVTGDYSPSSPNKGSYWVRLVITSPNSMFAEGKYQIKCS
jgi:hypothetical protein